MAEFDVQKTVSVGCSLVRSALGKYRTSIRVAVLTPVQEKRFSNDSHECKDTLKMLILNEFGQTSPFVEMSSSLDKSNPDPTLTCCYRHYWTTAACFKFSL